jgi:hypothetical protein
MRRCVESVTAQTDGKGKLQSFEWRRKRYCVTRTLDSWRYVGKWWLGLRQTRRYYRVEARHAQSPQVFELYQQDDNWFLLAVQD